MCFPYISQTLMVSYNSPWQVFLAEVHGWFFLSFVEVTTNRILPKLLNIHHQDYMSQYNIYLIILIQALFIFALFKNFAKYFKNKSYAITSIFIIGFIAFCLQYNAGGFWWFNHDIWFYSYNMNQIFPLLLFSAFEYSYVLYKKEFTKKELFGIVVLILFTAIGHEYFRIILLTSLPIIFLLNNIFLKEKIKTIKFFIFYFSMFIVNISICFIFFFQEWMTTKLRTIDECKSIFIPYMKNYFYTVIAGNKVLFLLIAISIIYLIFGKFAKKEEIKRLFIYSFSVIVSVLIFNVIIITGVEDYEYYFNHPGCQFLTKTTLFFILLSIIGYILQKHEKSNQKVIFILVMTCLLIFHYSPYIRSLYVFRDTVPNDIKDLRQKLYLVEKLFYLYGKNNKTLYIPLNSNINRLAIYEYLTLYDYSDDIDAKIKEYEIVKLDDNYDINFWIDLIKEKTGYEVSDEEIEECRFSNIKSH